MSRLQKYFNLIADKIAVDAQLASTSYHRPDIGFNREKFLELFLHKHLPKRLSAYLGGQIIGLGDIESGQIDIIVANDISIRFEENARNFITAESVAAAITVKSFLDKAGIVDCLSNLASIPQFSPQVLTFKALRSNAFDTFISKHPSLFIFAYDGVQYETCLDHIADFYNSNPNIPLNRYPLNIIVNKKYMIKFVRQPGKTIDGDNVPGSSFYPSILQASTVGWPFIHMIDDITSYVSWLPYMDTEMHHYFNLSYLARNEAICEVRQANNSGAAE
ncbi:MAG: hypothetical protein HC827_19155 [Cyanobacteria bacterium RM1_2_2]|nr:hypothetical protein [Cyanobacteria bacterium RM1_2_2]